MRIAAAVVFTTCLAAQQPRSAVDLVIQRLANPDAAAADAAMVDLIRGGPANTAVLQRAVAATRDPACRARAERALALCAVDAPVDNGVKIGLRADRKEVAPGEAVALAVTVCNVTDKPVALFLGMSYSGNVLQNGLALQQCGPDGAPTAQGRFGAVGFCGTGAQPLVEVLPPWSTREFALNATYRLAPESHDAIRHVGPHLATMKYVYLPLERPPAGGPVRLRLCWAVDPSTAVGMVEPAVKPDWKGTLLSNPIELRLREGR